MWARICAVPLAAALLACASEPARPPVKQSAPAPAAPPAPPPADGSGSDKTAADPALKRDVEKLIAQCEQQLGTTGRVIDTHFERVEQQTVVESWTVARVGDEVVYPVKLTPGEQGVEIWVGCPPQSRVK